MIEILIYEEQESQQIVDVCLEGETIWLTQEHMAALFCRERSVITMHLRNIFKDGELGTEATCAKFAQAQSEGGSSVTREIDHDNLDAITIKALGDFRDWLKEIRNKIKHRQHLQQAGAYA